VNPCRAQFTGELIILSDEQYDVLIVGAGAAGLLAGLVLADVGRRVVILEARDRIGGRIFTRHESWGDPAAFTAMELGAEFIHGLPSSTWALVRDAGLTTYELDGAPWCFENGSLRPRGEEHHDAFETLQQMSQWLACQPPGTDATFAEYLDQQGITGSKAKLASAYVEGFNAADRGVIGVAALVRQQQAENLIQADRIFHIREGYAALVEFLAQRFLQAGGSMLMDCPVRSLQWKPGELRASAVARGGRHFTLLAKQAVITLPLGVLQAQAVDFDPIPQQLRIHAGRLRMGSAIRITLLFHTRFWGDAAGDMSFLFARDESLPTWWTCMPASTPLITAWVAGPKAIALAQNASKAGYAAALLDEALRALARMFGTSPSRLMGMLAAWHTHDWQADPYSRGAYSYAPSGALDASLQLAQPVANTLFFAGEHTDVQGHWGTVHAALDSGQRAADQLMAAR
jgi:monoamine oxidase